MTTSDLTPMEAEALEALRNNSEGCCEVNPTTDEEWHSIYLDNAKPRNWSGKTWSGVLGSLSRKGLYRDDDGYAFGMVLKSKQ